MYGMDLINAIRAEKAEPPAGIRTLALDRTHRWITDLSPGRVVFTWTVDPAYFNLEGAVICSWTAAVGDQALFLASNTLCGPGEGTRMAQFSLENLSNITHGELTITGVIERRVDKRIWGTCTFVDSDGNLAAKMTAQLDIINA